MSRWIGKAISVLLAAVLLTAAFPLALADGVGGVTGGEMENITWILDENGVLTIGGSGTMPGFSEDLGECSPWYGEAVTAVVIENGVESVGEEAFCGFDSLTSVEMADSVTYIGESAFANCRNLESVSLSKKLRWVDRYAFFGCAKLAELPIDDSLADVRAEAFGNTLWLQNQPEGIVYAGRVAYTCKGDCPASVTLLPGTKGIAEEAFAGRRVQRVVIPDGLTYIGNAVFSASSLTSVIIPASVTRIGSDAFEWLEGLTVYGYEGSYAEKFVQDDSGIIFIAITGLCPHCSAPLTEESIVRVEGTPATYTQTGLTEGTRCAACGEWITEPQVIEKKPIDFVIGDISGDGALNIGDVTLLQQYLAEYFALDFEDEKTLLQADFNGDGKVNIKDATAMQRSLAEIA